MPSASVRWRMECRRLMKAVEFSGLCSPCGWRLRQRFVVAAPALALDTQVYEYLQDPSFADGLLLTSAWAWWSEAGVAGMQDLLALRPEVAERDWSYVQMTGAVSVARRALEGAILAAGFQDLSPQTVFAALEHMQDYPAL